MSEETHLSKAKASLERMQNFDTGQLARDELGKSFNFRDAIEPAERLKALFKKVPIGSLEEFPEQQLNNIQKQADSIFNLLEQVSGFDETQANATEARNGIIQSIKEAYQNAFNNLMPFISYGVARTVDFSRLEDEGRAVLQGIEDQTEEALKEIDTSKEEASKVLEEIKKTAAEQGVSQQAHYFSEEAKHHATEADNWKKTTKNWAWVLIGYGVISFFLHKIPIIAPSGTPEAIIFVASKVLIFAVLTYMLVLSARNFLSHKHNAVVNKHRQNALMTFNALVKAGQGQETQDIILNHASACIFTAQDTGYTKHGGSNSGQMPNLVDLVPKASVRVDQTP